MNRDAITEEEWLELTPLQREILFYMAIGLAIDDPNNKFIINKGRFEKVDSLQIVSDEMFNIVDEKSFKEKFKKYEVNSLHHQGCFLEGIEGTAIEALAIEKDFKNIEIAKCDFVWTDDGENKLTGVILTETETGKTTKIDFINTD